LLPWSQVEAQLARARFYWLATTRPDGRPHIAPVCGAWVDKAFYFQGMPTTRWARNIAENPAASIHLESEDDVVIVDGEVEFLVTDSDLAARLIDVWRKKPEQSEPHADRDGIFRLRPRSARAWGQSMQVGARWTFGDS
jgi:nitroimidazol reductase NimA-like FMN-containing flavoprotein (pyridoxamine 5'-phosphate oxidase superfamily)